MLIKWPEHTVSVPWGIALLMAGVDEIGSSFKLKQETKSQSPEGYLQPAHQNLISHSLRQGTPHVSAITLLLALVGVKAHETFLKLSLPLSVTQKKPWRCLTLDLSLSFRCNGANCRSLGKDNDNTIFRGEVPCSNSLFPTVPHPSWPIPSKLFLGWSTQ